MSIPLLSRVYDETRRLAIAGSAAAPGDFRLKKLVAPLEQAGQKAPVFARVAQAATRLVESDEASSPEVLLDLSTLVNAILYTQGETGAAGDLEPLETIEFGEPETQVPARVLKPLLEALTTTGSGRLETIKDAAERGAFRDVRLVRPAVDALDDSYPEIADWMAENVLPRYGKPIFPELRSAFDLKGRRGDARRLKLMHALDPAEARDVVKQSLDEGSKEVKVAAIECLGDNAADLALLLDLAKARVVDVRNAAMKGLGKSMDEAAVDALFAALQKDDFTAVEPIRSSPSSRLAGMVLEAAQSHFDTVLRTRTKDKVELGKLISYGLRLLQCLCDRRDKPAEEFFLSLFVDREKLAAIKAEPSGLDLRLRLLTIMSGSTPRCREALANSHATLEGEEFDLAFMAACSSQPSAVVFKSFAPYYTGMAEKKKARGVPGGGRRELIATRLQGHIQLFIDPPECMIQTEGKATLKLDDRWLDLVVEQEDLKATMNLARSGHKKANQFLLRAFEEQVAKPKTHYEALSVLQTMIRIGHPDAIDLFIRFTRTVAKSNPNQCWLGPTITQFPKEAVARIEAILPELPDTYLGVFLESLNALVSPSSV